MPYLILGLGGLLFAMWLGLRLRKRREQAELDHAAFIRRLQTPHPVVPQPSALKTPISVPPPVIPIRRTVSKSEVPPPSPPRFRTPTPMADDDFTPTVTSGLSAIIAESLVEAGVETAVETAREYTGEGGEFGGAGASGGWDEPTVVIDTTPDPTPGGDL